MVVLLVMKYICLDFDRTLFDTELFYNSLELTCICGQSESRLGVDYSGFIYPDVLEFLQKCQKAQYLCLLVTFGRQSVQEFKFKNSGIEPYFFKTFYVEQGSKAEAIKKYLDSGVSCEKLVFIDDTIGHLETFAKEFPAAAVLRMARPGAKGSEVMDDRFDTTWSLSQSPDLNSFLGLQS